MRKDKTHENKSDETNPPFDVRLSAFSFLLSAFPQRRLRRHRALRLAEQSHPAPPYTNWTTAAHVIQDAVDAAQTGDTVLVAGGVYATGGRAVGTTVGQSRGH